ncbi:MULTISPECIES: EAL and HDOD domain-containing protein [unclassified Colwellia]|jgi:EAL and modified HD-GYP domain-containing signal transduction protein|uniref:EAL and HDOD domain-containing protein n=1 Tax=unclassified Colwellia TaxID=196834 RepID=UPI0015F4EFAF|nr:MULTISPECIES: HDOD domain-containing protein [unclassified Colwellia]MBA6363671.1 HDOD domain-containing protein [Colwellia sp. BRX8-8]MBA6346758.1 HDOD domain-containing protein [Colwellia sp. BRX8-9]MBA6372324.1 HDOD domain-containing protein [Colwellia sp. BRX8-4]MBA6379323.1 HDOD domain-containing protein [Colwellia sp. BRX10-7]MBA6382929.1 HDOD domain-containing protein [Colwellia sp. BRX10-9]
MYNTYIARQAILDRNHVTIGYELLFRDSADNKFPDIDSDVASSKLIIQNHLQGDIRSISMGKLAFINFTEKCLINKYPLMFDKKSIVIELVGHKVPTERLFKIVKFYFDKGYKVALTEYDLDAKWDVLFPYISIIKVDTDKVNPKRLHKVIERLKDHNIKLAAEKVETNFQLQALAEVGFDYYQGYFYHEPEIVEGQTLAPIKTQMLHLISETFHSPLDFDNIATIISHDVNLTVGLLKMVNNVATSTRIEITSLKQAAAYLGEDKLKQFVTILALSKLTTDKTDEISKQALITAKLMTALAKEGAFKEISDFAFITGLLSAIEIILRMPINEIVKTMPLAIPIENALVDHSGLLGELLDFTVKYIRGNGENIKQLIEMYSLDETYIQQEFVAACQWCKELGI